MLEPYGDSIYDEPVKGHWLLSNEVNLITIVEAETNPPTDGNERFD